MADEEALHRCVTKFMLNTCRYSTSEHAKISPFFHLLYRVFTSELGDVDMFISGSSAEFSIKPMLSCIGDIDMMRVIDSFLAIPRGYTPPTVLPDYYYHNVLVLEIIDSGQPGYVYLQTSYILTKTDNGRYVTLSVSDDLGVLFATCDRRNFLRLRVVYDEEQLFATHSRMSGMDFHIYNSYMNQNMLDNSQIPSLMTVLNSRHGPATQAMLSSYFKNTYTHKDKHRCFSLSSMDYVLCIRCLHWPLQANSWPTRYRYHGWPDISTINRVVSSGCDLVPAVHPRCRQDEWMMRHQLRLSFSRAEVTLLNSWTPVQQIIYHMLRFIMKRKVFPKTNDSDQDAPKLCNYHIKTLMLWQCEQKPQSWWSAESSLIKLCSSLLHKLAGWVNDKSCKHYFINHCDLLDHFLEDAYSLTISNTLKSLADESILLIWFVENYIRRCAECCPTKVAKLFRDICSSEKLERAIQVVVDWKWSSLPNELYTEHHDSELMINSIMSTFRLESFGVMKKLMKELQNFDPRLRDYFVALTGLRVAYTISIHSLTEELLEILWMILDLSAVEVGKPYSGECLSTRKAIELARLRKVGSNALEMLYQEITKAYLHQSLAYDHCVVHVLLAALYYMSGHYQTAVDHCKQVLEQSFPEYHRSQRIGTEYLPQIDHNVDSVCGLVLLYQHVQANALHPGVYPQEVGTLAFTVELLAHYLYSQCLTAAISKRHQVTKYQQQFSKTQRLHVCDVLLFKEMEMQFHKCAEIPVVNTGADEAIYDSFSSDPSLLVITLELVALEKLITFRQVMVQELHSEQFPILNEFEALYSYKCGLFDECLEMCRNHVKLLLTAGCSRSQRYVTTFPQAVSLLDVEMMSLFGIIKIMHPVLFLLLLEFPAFDEI